MYFISEGKASAWDESHPQCDLQYWAVWKIPHHTLKEIKGTCELDCSRELTIKTIKRVVKQTVEQKAQNCVINAAPGTVFHQRPCVCPGKPDAVHEAEHLKRFPHQRCHSGRSAAGAGWESGGESHPLTSSSKGPRCLSSHSPCGTMFHCFPMWCFEGICSALNTLLAEVL